MLWAFLPRDLERSPSSIHKALEQTTQMCCDAVTKIGETGVQGMCWDYLWANYSVLGDSEYGEFEENSSSIIIVNCISSDQV